MQTYYRLFMGLTLDRTSLSLIVLKPEEQYSLNIIYIADFLCNFCNLRRLRRGMARETRLLRAVEACRNLAVNNEKQEITLDKGWPQTKMSHVEESDSRRIRNPGESPVRTWAECTFTPKRIGSIEPNEILPRKLKIGSGSLLSLLRYFADLNWFILGASL